MMAKRFLQWMVWGVTVCAASACSRGPTPVRPPSVDPQAAAASAMDRYDADQNGQLDGEELASCPGLLEGIQHYDQDQNKSIDGDEIAARLAALYGNGVGMLNLGCRVLVRGEPVPEVQVRLVPETFLGGAVKPAEGTTRDSGTAMLRIAPEDLPDGLKTVRGVHSGVYRVELSHPSPAITKFIDRAGPLGFDVSVEDQVTGLTVKLGR